MKNQKLTTAIINARLSKKSLRMIGEFTGSNRHKAAFECAYGHQWQANISNVLYSHGCPQCSPNARLSLEYVTHNLKGRGITLIGEYVSNKKRTRFRCDVDPRHEWESTYFLQMKGKGCPYCSGFMIHSSEVIERLARRQFQLMEEYVNTSQKALIRCQFGHEWRAKIETVLRKSGCPHCYRLSLKRRNYQSEITAPEVVINAIRLVIRAEVDSGIDLDELHHAEKQIRGFIEDQGHQRYMGLRQEIANSLLPPDMSLLKLTQEEVFSRLTAKGLVIAGKFSSLTAITDFECPEIHTFEETPLRALHYGCPSCRRAPRKAATKPRQPRQKELQGIQPEEAIPIERIARTLRTKPLEQPDFTWRQKTFRRGK